MNRRRTVMLLCVSITTGACTGELGARPADSPQGHASSADEGEDINLATGRIIDRLRKQYSDRMAGLYLDREKLRIVVRLTGAQKVPEETHKVGNKTLNVVFVPDAAHSFSELQDIMSAAADKIQRRLPSAHARYVNEASGEIVIAVSESREATSGNRDALSAELGVPVQIVVRGAETARPRAISSE